MGQSAAKQPSTGDESSSRVERALHFLADLSPDELDDVKRQLFLLPADESPDDENEPEFELDIHVEDKKDITTPPRSPRMPLNYVNREPSVMNRPVSPKISPRMPKALNRCRAGSITHPAQSLAHDNKHRDAVVVSSLSLDWEELAKVPGIVMYELRLLWHLYMLRNPKVRVVFCTSQHVPQELIDYYLRYLPGDVSVEDCKKRLLMLACNDQRSFSVTEKLLSRPKTIHRIRKFIDVDNAYMTCFNSTDTEAELAEKVGIPLMGNNSDVAVWGMKNGNRQLFKEAGVQHPDGTYESAFDLATLARNVLDLWKRHPDARKIMVKLNESFSGEGNAILRLIPELRQKVLAQDDDEVALAATQAALQTSLEYVAQCESWPHYYSQIQKLGSICELFVEGDADAKTSPSCQGFLSTGGKVQILATHEQWLNGQIYIGCHFPANEAYAGDLISRSEKIAEALGKKGVIGYFAIDYVSVRQADGSYDHWAIEINVRMGGTTLPIMTLDLLCQNGRLDPQTSKFIATDGTPRYYTASDNIRNKRYKGLLTEDIIDLVQQNSEEIEFGKRPGAPETGVIFHLVPLLSELGKVGCVCIGRSREEAKGLYDKVVKILDDEACGEKEEVATAETPDEADRLA